MPKNSGTLKNQAPKITLGAHRVQYPAHSCARTISVL